MILLFPIPGFITKKIQDVQRVRMKKVRNGPAFSWLLPYILPYLDGRPRTRCDGR